MYMSGYKLCVKELATAIIGLLNPGQSFLWLYYKALAPAILRPCADVFERSGMDMLPHSFISFL